MQVPTTTAMPGVDGITPPGAKSNVGRGATPAVKGGPGGADVTTVWCPA